MPFLLRSAGALWTFLGISNIVGLPWAFIANDFTLRRLVLNGGLFVIPGLALMRLAEAVERKRAPTFGERGIEEKREQP
jgi:hypothetical protein